MYNICVFAGTTEGRELIEFLSTRSVRVTACVATEYGSTLLPESENLQVSARRLPVDEIRQMLSADRFDLVIDATHPYAQSITKSIEAACSATDTEYLRLLRAGSQLQADTVCVADTSSAVEFLQNTSGSILLTTGSKELPAYAALKNFSERVYARVLPMDASLTACRDAGLKPAHILAMQGPFSEEMNLAMLRFTNAAWLVTKDGGAAGGFEEKASAAQKAGAKLLVIGRPEQREGISLSDTIRLLCEKYGFQRKPRVTIVGIGPGSRDVMTGEVLRALEHADCLIGAGRMLEAVAVQGQAVFDAISPANIAGIISENPQYSHFAVVMSGDSGFFSGTKKLLPLLSDCDVRVLPGISSLSYLCSRVGLSYEDTLLRSLHGRDYDPVPDVRANHRVFTLVGGENGAGNLARTLTEAGLGGVSMYVGERLSYPEERIVCGTAAELAEQTFAPLSAALIENPAPDAVVTHGLPDSAFLRGAGAEGVVPMTKSEVRSVCLSKLQLREDAVCWDVGAGTGSVAIEMALQAKKGQVWAIERKEDAVALLEQNARQFRTGNLTVVSGKAPDCCTGLPAPTHVFIGGSSGNMKAILELVLRKNPNVRIVATAIALESAAELTGCMKQFPWAETEVVSMQVAKDRKAGPYHLMTGQNPIFIFTLQAGGAAQ